MLDSGGEPHPVVDGIIALIAQYKDDLFPNVNCDAAEHRAGPGRQSSDRFEHELMRDSFAQLDGLDVIVPPENGRTATRFRHRTQDTGILPLKTHRRKGHKVPRQQRLRPGGSFPADRTVLPAVAGYLPARRASRIDPMLALRAE